MAEAEKATAEAAKRAAVTLRSDVRYGFLFVTLRSDVRYGFLFVYKITLLNT
jgi:hypothetical protein